MTRPHPATLAAAAALDLVAGDPRGWPHPVRAFGWVARRLEPCWRRVGRLRAAGVGYWLCLTAGAGGVAAGSLGLAGRFRGALEAYWIYTLLATRDLVDQTAAPIRALEEGRLEKARWLTGRIVGRDVGALNEREIVRAVLETTAENLSDGVVAPLFYLALGGAPAMAAYKAANTLDSMVGRRDAGYREFGWFSARADDALNFIPARLTAALLALTAIPLRLDALGAWRAMRRDAHRQPSPNAGWPEAALAGALRVRLGGLNFYGGRPVTKPPLGESLEPLTRRKYWQARPAIFLTAVVATALASAAALAWRRF